LSGNSSVKVNNLQVKLIPDSSDELVSWSAVSNLTVIEAIGNLYANSVLLAANVIIKENTTPANSTVSTVQGKIWSDGDYIYYSVSNSSIKRVALSSF
jgi:hypothetical protein